MMSDDFANTDDGCSNGVTTSVERCLSCMRRRVIRWSVRRPLAALFMVIGFSVLLLPAVTATSLMPFAIIITYSGLLASKGLAYTLYSIILQGILLGAMVTMLFLASFAIATSASVLHSYRFFNKQKLLAAAPVPTEESHNHND